MCFQPDVERVTPDLRRIQGVGNVQVLNGTTKTIRYTLHRNRKGGRRHQSLVIKRITAQRSVSHAVAALVMSDIAAVLTNDQK